MYTFTIENTDKNMIVDNKIIGGGDQFKVYKVSDFVRIVVNEDTKMNQLCEYFFAYIVYDKLVDETGRKMYYELQKKWGELEVLIITKLNRSVVDENMGLDVTNSENIHEFSNHISSLFLVTSAGSSTQTMDVNRTTWEDISRKINLSQGQYLYHLDSVYKKYESIYHNEKDDHRLKKILDIHDASFRRGYHQGDKYSFHDKIEFSYTELQTIKDSNFFYKTEHFYIQDENILTQQFTKLSSIKELLRNHGIEKLIHIYYTYISLKDLKRLYKFIIDLRKAIAEFTCYNNFDIVNLLIFQDILFYKIIKNGASIIYNVDGSVDPVSKPLLKDTLTVDDNTRDDNINEYHLKHQLFYRYKELEKALRRYYLPNFYFIIDGKKRENPEHSAIDIIHIRQTTLEDDLCLLDTEGEIIIDKMKKVTTFYKNAVEYQSTDLYKPGQLVKCLVAHSMDNSLDSVDVVQEQYFVGEIQSVNNDEKTCSMKLLAEIKDNYTFDDQIEELSSQSNVIDLSNPTIDDIRNKFSSLFKVSETGDEKITIPFHFIYDTSILLGRRIPQRCAFFDSFKIQYRDVDLFNPEFDREIYTYIKILYEIPNNDVLFIKPESIQNIRPERKALVDRKENDDSIGIDNLGQDDEIDRKYVYIIFEINKENTTLTPKICNLIELCDIGKIFDENKHLEHTYNDGDTYCMLIEKVDVDGDNYIEPGFDDIRQLDKLYFSNREIKI